MTGWAVERARADEGEGVAGGQPVRAAVSRCGSALGDQPVRSMTIRVRVSKAARAGTSGSSVSMARAESA